VKQILQDLKKGRTILTDVPVPTVKKGFVLIQTTRSLVSLGTERMLVEFGKANYLAKTKKQPERVKMVLEKIKSDGLMPTINTVLNKLDQPLPLGYCNVGNIIEVGEGVQGFSVGDRVASNGPHAEFVCVPKNLVARVPDNVTDEEAVFTVIGAIALQGIRLCKPTFGETIVVYGLGLIGLITTLLLKSNGCNVIGIDLDENKLSIARNNGIETINPAVGQDTLKTILALTNQIGADGVIITASASTNDIISQSAQMCRKRGRIVLVGVVGLDISRADFYEKELTFQVSCSYGPGRYDNNYETKGNDYPLPFVRWTENRNFEAILAAIATGRLDVKPLISNIFNLEDFDSIYSNISKTESIASILKYPSENIKNRSIKIVSSEFIEKSNSLGIIGAGNFTQVIILPSLKKANAKIKSIASASGVSGTTLAKKYGILYSTSDYNEIIEDQDIKLVIIATQHDSHARITEQVLKSGKSVFVEKPLALNNNELDKIVNAYEKNLKSDNCLTLTVGYNRRFSPHIIKVKQYLNPKLPINIAATMNAGNIPKEVWVHDMKIGGGRIIGEACHYIDLVIYLTGSRVKSICMNSLGSDFKENTDNASILLRFENGSNAVINYFANGAKSYPKERIEVYSQERVFIIDNFRITKAYGVKNFSNLKTKQDKGHISQFKELINRLEVGGPPLIPFNEIINGSRASFAAIDSMKHHKWISIEE